jgi:hypothetical protein
VRLRVAKTIRKMKTDLIYNLFCSWFNHLANISKDLAEIEERLEK